MNSHKADFEYIFSTTKESLFSYIKKFIDKESDIEDIMQECYIRLWVNIEDVQEPDNALYLLFTYSKNLIIDRVRKRAVEKKNLLEYSYLLNDTIDSHTAVEHYSILKKMKDVLLVMPKQKRMVFLLKKEQGLTTREIAERLNITPRSVRRHMEEAISFLRNHFSSAELLALIIVKTTVIISPYTFNS
jgi:RNA polymerase sigma-70 factor (ECF subfamily)